MSAAHRMPPAKSAGSQHEPQLYKEYAIPAGFCVHWTARIECRQQHIKCHHYVNFVDYFLKKHGFEGLYNLVLPYDHLYVCIYIYIYIQIQSHDGGILPFCLGCACLCFISFHSLPAMLPSQRLTPHHVELHKECPIYA